MGVHRQWEASIGMASRVACRVVALVAKPHKSSGRCNNPSSASDPECMLGSAVVPSTGNAHISTVSGVMRSSRHGVGRRPG